MRGCPSCQAQVIDEARFCTTCGAPMGGSETADHEIAGLDDGLAPSEMSASWCERYFQRAFPQ